MIKADDYSKRIPRNTVVVVHGFGGKKIWMMPLCRRLRSNGFHVINWGYPSLFGTLDRHAANLCDFLSENCHQSNVHILAHSMGSIVVRSALSKAGELSVGRVVLFAPPNAGTPVARFAARLLGSWCQPVSALSDQQESYVNQLLPSNELEIAVVAARFDILIPVANTHLEDEREHVVLNATHNSLLISRRASDLAMMFLKNGKFE